MEKVIFKNLTNVKFQQLNKLVLKKDKVRTQLTGVFLDLNRSKLVVTNTHSLFAYDIQVLQESDDPELFDVVIDPKIFNQQSWLSVPKEDAEFVEFHVFADKTEVVLNEEIVAVAKNIAHEQAFPINWKHVVERKFPKEEFFVDPKLFGQAIQAIPAGFTPKFEVGEKILVSGSMEVDEYGKAGFEGVIMPLNFGEYAIFNQSEAVEVSDKIIGRITSQRAIRSWKEDFVDEDTGNVIAIDRNEIVLERETLIDPEALELLKTCEIKSIMVHKISE